MRCLGLFLATLLLLAPGAWGGTLALILSDGSKPYQEYHEALNQSFGDSSWRIVIATQDAALAQSVAPELIVTAGSDALRRTLTRTPTQPVLATLLTRQSYEKILAENSGPARRTSAIFLDQPASRQVALIRHLFPEYKRVGMLISPETRQLVPRFQNALANRGLHLEQEMIESETTLLPALNGLLGRCDLLLATPDTTVYHRGTLKSILITALRAQKAVIGFSESMTHSGALAAIYATPSQVAKQTAYLVHTQGNALPPPVLSAQFTLSINQNVAQSLGLRVPDEATLLKAMQAESDTR